MSLQDDFPIGAKVNIGDSMMGTIVGYDSITNMVIVRHPTKNKVTKMGAETLRPQYNIGTNWSKKRRAIAKETREAMDKENRRLAVPCDAEEAFEELE